MRFQLICFPKVKLMRGWLEQKGFSENKKKFVWSLAILPTILGQQYTSQLLALDMAV